MVPKLVHRARHKIFDKGRRWRKTTAGGIAAIKGHGPIGTDGLPLYRGALQGANIWFLDQHHRAATSVWLWLRGTLRPITKHVSEADRRILLWNDGAITVRSAHDPSSLVGDIRGIDGVVMNEAAKYSPLVWQQAIRPALADRKGWSIWPSTPEGMNYFYDLYMASTRDASEWQDANEGLVDWQAWREPSFANPFFDRGEIEAARAEGTPENLIRQEFYAEFIQSGAGRTYYEFERAPHVRDDVAYDPSQPLDLCLAFSTAPAVWLVTQGTLGRERVIAEIVLPSGEASPRLFVQELVRQFPRHAQGQNVRIFGEVPRDGGPSDFEQVKALLPRARPLWNYTTYEERDRVNATNATLRNRHGEVGATIHSSCTRLIRDLEGSRNADASYKVDHKQTTIGHYANAWGCKLLDRYPAIVDSVRSVREDRNAWGFPADNPHRRKAYDAYWAAVRSGKIVRPDHCEKCGAMGDVQADHRDHDKALEVTHLCKPCHRAMPAAPCCARLRLVG